MARNLLLAQHRKALPKLGDTEHAKQSDVKVVAKFFTPDSNWTWYVTEFDGNDRCFGFVCGLEKEFGYFSLRELQAVRGPMGLGVERDRYFANRTLADVLELEGRAA
jgi:hypothetical protein